jgi:hypothetical protein
LERAMGIENIAGDPGIYENQGVTCVTEHCV